MPVCGTSPFTLETLNNDINDILYTESFLEDETSKNVLRNTINFRLSGDIKYLIECETPENEGYSLITNPNKEEILMDCGAYTGDTIEKFSCFVKGFTDLYAAEPCPKSYAKLKSKFGEYNIHNCAIGKESGETFFLSSRGRGSVISSESAHTGKLLSIPVKTVDEILCGNKCTILKFDIEGFEEDGLIGSFETISKYHPSMLVAAYHKEDDVYRIPLLIKRYFPKYKIYLRHHPCLPSWETNVYAVYSD
jgi:FkbM family methyltransferase